MVMQRYTTTDSIQTHASATINQNTISEVDYRI